jgi:hypothetical protein
MSLLRSVARGFRTLFRKEQVDRELDEELRTYQEMASEEKMKQGMGRKEAARAARLERGNLEVTKEVVRSAGWESVLEEGGRSGRFQLEAAIQSVHAERAQTGRTDWAAIAMFYQQLNRIAPTLGMRVGYAAAIAEAEGPEAGLAVLDPIASDAVAHY